MSLWKVLCPVWVCVGSGSRRDRSSFLKKYILHYIYTMSEFGLDRFSFPENACQEGMEVVVTLVERGSGSSVQGE